MNIKTKLILAIGIPLLLFAVLGSIIFINLQKIITTNHWVTHTHNVLGTADNIVGSAVDMETGMRGFLLAGKEDFLAPYKAGEKETYKLLNELQQTVSDNPPQVERLKEVEKILKQWQQNVTTPMIELRRSVGAGKTMDEVANLVGEAKGKQYFDKFRSIMNEFKNIERNLMEEREKESDATALNSEKILVIGIIIAMLFGISLGIYIVRDLIKQLGKEPSDVNQITSRIASGDLTMTFDNNVSSDSVYGSIRTMNDGLLNIVSGIKDTTTQLTESAEKTSVIAEQTSKSIQTQVNETTNVANAIKEMGTAVKDVAENVVVAASESDKANELAIGGRETMKQTVGQMDELNSDVEQAAHVVEELENNTNEINSIVEVIRGIAEQTNLLALDAAIEAARAGEQGRGFAVVADEVRTLAERTQNSTQEINQMIDKLQSGVRNAVKVMEQSKAKAGIASKQALKTDDILNTILEAINSINDMNTQISSAAEQQSAVMEEISGNVINVQNMAEDTSQGAKQAAETGTDLSKLATNLQEMITQFKT